VKTTRTETVLSNDNLEYFYMTEIHHKTQRRELHENSLSYIY